MSDPHFFSKVDPDPHFPKRFFGGTCGTNFFLSSFPFHFFFFALLLHVYDGRIAGKLLFVQEVLTRFI